MSVAPHQYATLLPRHRTLIGAGVEMAQRDSGLGQALNAALVLSCIAAGPGVLVWQLWTFLTEGNWHPVSVLHLLEWAGTNDAWVHAPTSWIGLWKVLSWMPLSLTAMIVGAVSFYVAVND